MTGLGLTLGNWIEFWKARQGGHCREGKQNDQGSGAENHRKFFNDRMA